MGEGKSPSEESLSGKARGHGRWHSADTDTDFPQLAGSLRLLSGTEEAEPSLQGTEGVARSTHGHTATRVTQGGSSCHPEASSASAPGFPRAGAIPSGKGLHRAADGGPVPRPDGHWLLSSAEQQVKASGCWDPVSSPPSRRSSAEENILDARVGRRRPSAGSQSPCPSTPELLRPQTPPSPGSAVRSRSVRSLSAPSSEGHGPSEERSGSLPGSTDVPAAAAREPCCPWGAEGSALHTRGALLDSRGTAGRAREISSYQADYWACAIPDGLPPSPDRSSPHWNPNKEYEDLLDYAYPLKPRYKLGRMPEPFFHDSGIDLDSFSASPEGMSRSTSIYGRAGQARGSRENGLWDFVAPPERFSTPRPGKRGCSGAGSYYEPLPLARSASSHPSRGFAKDVRVESSGLSSPGCPAASGRSWDTTGRPCPISRGQVEGTTRFLPITGMLPLRREWEGDEEFLSLPPRLQELERLAQFLSNLSLTVRTPGHDHQNLPLHSTSKEPLSCRLAPFGGVRDDRGSMEGCAGLCQHHSPQNRSWENTELDGWIHGDPPQGLHLPADLRDTLDGMCLNEPRAKGHPKKSQQSQSLIQCVKMFCCQLEELICWLYSVVDVTSSWVPPSPEAESVAAALRRYLEFRRDVADHQSLTESVLQRGEALLDCMASSSPALKDTLALIARQSEELESHAEHLYRSILAAVGPVQSKDTGQDRGSAAHSCSLGAASVRPRLR